MTRQEEQNIETLNQDFGDSKLLRFERGPGDLPCAVVDTPACRGRMYLHGSHVTEFQPSGHDPVLFVSRATRYEPGKAIRGGVPICFPWFGPHATDPSQPSHGTARITTWNLGDVDCQPERVTLHLEQTFEPYHARFSASFGHELTMSLHVTNTSDTPNTFEAALHSYFVVKDVQAIEITGLEGVTYIDQVDHHTQKQQDNAPIRFTSETDRIYINTPHTCTLTDPGLKRRISVDKSGSLSTVVWNPWINKAKALTDLGDDEWPGFVCIETANAGPNAITLEPGQSHITTATISVTRL